MRGGARLGERRRAGPRVIEALQHAYARWDGRVFFLLPGGEGISLLARLVHLVHVAQTFHRLVGLAAADDVGRARRATEFDPRLSDLWLAHRAELLRPFGGESIWEAALAAEPERLSAMAEAARSVGRLDAAQRLADLVMKVAGI